MAARKNGTWRAIVAVLVIAVGISTAWALVVGWIISLGESFTLERGSEELAIAADGTPIIRSNTQSAYQSVVSSQRTLDGKPWPVEYEYWLSGGNLAPYAFPAGLVRMPLNWNWGGRVGGYSDGSHPPAAWYIIRDDEPESHCYFAGIDSATKLPVGYIGRKGFRATAPDRDERFALPGVYGRALPPFFTSTQYFEDWGPVRPETFGVEQREPAQWIVYAAERDKVWELDLRKRSARVFADVPGIVSISMIDVLKTTMSPGGGAASAAATGNSPALVSEKDRKKAPDTVYLIAVRTSDKLVLFTTDGQRHEFALPHELPNKDVYAYLIAPHEMLYEYRADYSSDGHTERLLWADEQGKLAKDVTVDLAGYHEGSPRNMAWAMSATAPVPIAYSVGAMLVAPLAMVQNYAAPTFAAGVGKSLAIAWPPLVAVLVVGAILCWWTVRLQRKYHGSATATWAAFVFLLGVPGFLAYLIECRSAKLEACRECGEIVPRDREACAACAKEFRAPARVGTEILA